MTDWFAEPNQTDMIGIFELFRYINNSVEGLFFPVMLLVIWIVSFIALLFSGSIERPSAAKAWTFASFFVTILSMPLVILGLVAQRYMYISIILLGIGALWLILESGRD